jgi:mannose-6-phosphate isomerase-like protein (cupin superfamily)
MLPRMSEPGDVTRDLSLIEFHHHAAVDAGGARRWRARAQNFSVEWVQAQADGAEVTVDSPHETLVLVFGQPAQLAGGAAAPVTAAPRSAAIVAAGKAVVRLAAGGACAVLASRRHDLDPGACLNAAAFTQHDPRITPWTPAFHRVAPAAAVQVIPIDGFAAPADNPRLKMLQTDTLSINWVDYDGPRDRRSLSPHSHADLEQGSLAVAGRFVHHLRQHWGKNADLWRDDRHLEVGSPSLMVVPVNLVHTSEGVGAGHHLLIDVFSPPRRDFIAKGWVHNAADYRDPRA